MCCDIMCADETRHDFAVQDVTPECQQTFTCQNWFLDVLELRDVEQSSDHSFHDSDLRSDSQGEKHREEEKTPRNVEKAWLFNKIKKFICYFKAT